MGPRQDTQDGHPLGAAALRRGSSEPCVSLVLPPRSDQAGSRPFDLFQEPAWSFPRQRSAAPSVRDGGRALHLGGTGERAASGGGCQPCSGGCEPAELDAAGGLGSCDPHSRGRDAGRPGIPVDTRRCCLWRGQPGRAEVRITFRPGIAMDRGKGRPGLFCLFHQLSDRHGQRRDPRRGGHPFDPPGRGWSGRGR